jgi:hypothetical protein
MELGLSPSLSFEVGIVIPYYYYYYYYYYSAPHGLIFSHSERSNLHHVPVLEYTLNMVLCDYVVALIGAFYLESRHYCLYVRATKYLCEIFNE